MYKSYSMELAGRTLTVDIGRVAKQANGAALMHYGDTTVLATATASKEPREGIDFFPLSVEYEEKMYAVGKIPGGFNKREGKASEHAILTSRVIDRPMRPLFPKDYRNDVTLVNMVMSVDPECNPEIPAMLGSSIATCISDIPFDGPCATTQVGLIDGEFIINPSLAQKELSDLQLTVASTREKVIMIEAGANEVPEDTMIEAIYKAHDVNQEIIRFIDKIVAECGKEKHLYASCAVPEELFEAIKKIVPSEEMEEAVFTDDKQTREENIREITARLQEAFADNEEWLAVLGEAVYQYQKKTVRKMILKDHKRPDGRQITQIRPLAAEVDIIPRVHGSAMFTRGQTQICTMTTLAPLSEAQRIDGLDEFETSKRYMHHYNFPSYSVGETKPSRGPGRREIGHGALAERALVPVYHENDIADAFVRLDEEERKRLYPILGAEQVAEIFTYIDDPDLYLNELDLDKAARVISYVDSDDAVDVLDELDDSKQAQLVELLDEESSHDIKMIQSYEDDEVGSKMTTNFIVIKNDLTIRQAMRELVQQMRTRICDHPEVEQLMQELALQLETVKGKKSYGYLPKKQKALVDEIVDQMEQLPP